MVWAQVLTLALGIAVAVNLGRWANRRGGHIDVSVEGLSSLSRTSLDLLGGIDQPVTITAFITKDLPARYKVIIEDYFKALSSAGATGKQP